MTSLLLLEDCDLGIFFHRKPNIMMGGPLTGDCGLQVRICTGLYCCPQSLASAQHPNFEAVWVEEPRLDQPAMKFTHH